METERKAFYIRRMCSELGFNPIERLLNDMEYNIISEEETLCGTLLLLELKYGKTIKVPKEVMLEKSGNVYIAMSKGAICPFEENEIFIIKLTENSKATKKKIIYPVIKRYITEKLCVALTMNGDMYLISNKSIKTRPYGYIGRSFNGLPIVDKSFEFKATVPFKMNNNKTRWYDSYVRIYNVKHVKQIGKDFYEVFGTTYIDSSKTFDITAYVSV